MSKMPSNPGRARSADPPSYQTSSGSGATGRVRRSFGLGFSRSGPLVCRACGRAAVYCGLVVIAVAMGVVFDGNFPVVDSRTPVISRLEVFGSLALGPAEPGLRTLLYGAPVYGNSDSGKPDSSKSGPPRPSPPPFLCLLEQLRQRLPDGGRIDESP